MVLAFNSLQNKNQSILAVALDAGFEDHSAFSRRFKNTFGYSPILAKNNLSNINKTNNLSLTEPTIIELTNIELQPLANTGIYFEYKPKTLDYLNHKLSLNHLFHGFSSLFIGVSHSNSHNNTIIMSKDHLPVKTTFGNPYLAAKGMVLVEGLYASFCYIGKSTNLCMVYNYILNKLLQNSSFKINLRSQPFHIFEKFPNGLQEERIIINVPVV